MDLGTVWPPSSFDGGHNRSPSDIGDNSGRSTCRGEDRTCMNICRQTASTELGLRGVWQNAALEPVSWPPPHCPGAAHGGVYLQVAQGRPATG